LLEQTFIHVPGIGEYRERKLWQAGFTDWETFRCRHPDGRWKDLVASRLDRKRAASDLPAREAWRLLTGFRRRTAYLDIETTGLSIGGRDDVTCIGLSDGDGVKVFVQGKNLSEFPRAIRKYELLVTYNGACFDIPVLRTAFPEVDFRKFHHIDLRYPLHRLGLKGGLKGVEKRLGLTRAEAVQGVDGYMAVLLWQAHEAGHPNALETLVRYCLEDVVHLKPLAAHAYNHLSDPLPIRVKPVTDIKPPKIPYGADHQLVSELKERMTGRGRW
jgi:uncharacterized protein YprB with RNaseH-like and TPR domain